MSKVLDLLLKMENTRPLTKQVSLKRFQADGEEPVVFTLRGLTYSKIAEIKNVHEDFDVHVLLAGVADPDLKDSRLLEKYGAVTPAELVKKLLLPGEISAIEGEIEKLSGYKGSLLEDVAEVKKK